ncbi:hypothetical protein IH992_17260 [Candidatus Poribacteria bacterium]|nr:hypothetical protein [Candidatus Poribacteria bacterium]
MDEIHWGPNWTPRLLDMIRVYWRLLRRTLKRIMGREVLFSGNRESFRLLFLSRDSLLWYEIQNYARRRRKFKTLFVANMISSPSRHFLSMASEESYQLCLT